MLAKIWNDVNDKGLAPRDPLKETSLTTLIVEKTALFTVASPLRLVTSFFTQPKHHLITNASNKHMIAH